MFAFKKLKASALKSVSKSETCISHLKIQALRWNQSLTIKPVLRSEVVSFQNRTPQAHLLH